MKHCHFGKAAHDDRFWTQGTEKGGIVAIQLLHFDLILLHIYIFSIQGLHEMTNPCLFASLSITAKLSNHTYRSHLQFWLTAKEKAVPFLTLQRSWQAACILPVMHGRQDYTRVRRPRKSFATRATLDA